MELSSVNSRELQLLPRDIPQPLNYADSLIGHFYALSQLPDHSALAEALVAATADLTGCELVQLYLLDETGTCLTLSSQWFDGGHSPAQCRTWPSDYDGSQLLQYCLCQNATLSIGNLDGSLHDTAFLPEGHWRSLQCLPLADAAAGIKGLLVIASENGRDLEPYAGTLARLGSVALERARLLQRNHVPAEPASPVPGAAAKYDALGLIGDSVGMKDLHRLIAKVLHIPVTVLITGETGTGKELVARAIHDRGSRRAKPFIVQNCAALPEHLLESELFGYVKGAFTGAERDRKGLFDLAHEGTLFLDEIGDMPMALQAKLLRVLQEGELRPLGSGETRKVDVRIVTATHHDLRRRVQEGRFREDLYYRLAHFPVQIPALRDRGNDILSLARHFAANACDALQRPRCRWSDEALDALLTYRFPGNVRELKGLVERSVLLCEGGELLPEHFALQPEHLRAAPTMNFRERLDQVERNLLLDCLRRNNGNQSQAARELGLPRRTLLYRMKVLHISSKAA